jgi:hypothetical protein
MNKQKPSKRLMDGFTIACLSAIYMDMAGRMLKEDSRFYKQKNKQMLNDLMNANQSILFEIEMVHKFMDDNPQYIEAFAKERGDSEIEVECLHEAINIQRRIAGNFAGALLNSDDNKIFELDLYLENLVNGKKLYTEEELNYYISKQGK